MGREGTTPERRRGGRDKPIPKTWEFYRRTGFLWSDPYHMPEKQRKMLDRPDLEERFQERMQRRLEQEQAQKEQALREKKRQIKKMRSRLHARQIANAERSFPSEVRPALPAHLEGRRAEKIRQRVGCPEYVELREENEHNVKDRFFYRRTGNLWSDLKLVPKQRFHLVVNERIVAADRWGAEQIERRLREGQEQLESEERAKIKRAMAIKKDFRRQQQRNEAKWRSMGVLPKKSQRTSAAVRPASAGPAALQKALLRRMEVVSPPKTTGRRPKSACPELTQTADHAGLLHFDEGITAQITRFASPKARRSPKRSRPLVVNATSPELAPALRATDTPSSNKTVCWGEEETRVAAPQRSSKQAFDKRRPVSALARTQKRSIPGPARARSAHPSRGATRASASSSPTLCASACASACAAHAAAAADDDDENEPRAAAEADVEGQEMLEDDVGQGAEGKINQEPEEDGDSDGDHGVGGPPSQPLSSLVGQVPSLSAPGVVLNELDEFERRLKSLTLRGETQRPFYLSRSKPKRGAGRGGRK